MTEKLTPEQQRIAELFGTVEVLEALLVRVLEKTAQEGSLDDQALKQQIKAFIQISDAAQENEWSKHHANGMRSTAVRVGGKIRMGHIITNAAKRSSQGTA